MILRRTARKGFSLVEVLVAMAVLTFGIYGVAELVSASGRSAALSDARIQMHALAKLKLEELSAAASLDPELPSRLQYGAEAAYPVDGPRPLEQAPKYSWQSFTYSDPASTSTIRIRVEVTPTDKPNPIASITGTMWLEGSAPAGEATEQ